MRKNINTSRNSKSSIFHYRNRFIKSNEGGHAMGSKGRKNVKKPKKQKDKKEKGK